MGVGAGKDAGNHAARREGVHGPVLFRVRLAQPREVDGSVAGGDAGQAEGRDARGGIGHGAPAARRVHDQHGPPFHTERKRIGERAVDAHVGRAADGRDAEEIEDLVLQLEQRVDARLGGAIPLVLRVGEVVAVVAVVLGLGEAVGRRAVGEGVRAQRHIHVLGGPRAGRGAVEFQERGTVQHAWQTAWRRTVGRNVEKRLFGARAGIAHAQVVERRVAGVMFDADPQLFTPEPRMFGAQFQPTGGLDGGLGRTVLDAHDDGLAAAVEVVVTHGIAQRAVDPEAAKLALEVGVTVDHHGRIHRSAQRAADEGRHRRRHTGDGAHAARHFFNVDSRIGWRNWHRTLLKNLAASQIGVRFGGGRLKNRLDKAADFLKIVKVAVSLVGEVDDVAAPDGGLTGGGRILPP